MKNSGCLSAVYLPHPNPLAKGRASSTTWQEVRGNFDFTFSSAFSSAFDSAFGSTFESRLGSD